MPREATRGGSAGEATARRIEDLILEGSLRPGESLLPEREMAVRLNVSRPTLRQGIKLLEDKGLLVADSGGGRVVAALATSVTDPLIELMATRPDVVDETHAAVALIALAAVVLAVSGAADNVSAIYRSTMMQAAVPDAMRGRLQGIFIVVVAGGPRVGALYAGTLATTTALWVPPLFGGIVILGLVGTLVRFTPRFRAYDALNPQP